MKNQEEQLLNNLNEMKEVAKDLKAPQNVERIFEDAVNREKNVGDKNKGKCIFSFACSIVLALFLGVNASSVLAESVYRIPVLGNFAKVLTIREYNFENKASKMNVKVPGMESESESEIAKEINDMIESKIEYIVKEQKKLDEEYKEAYLETGGKIEELSKIQTKVDYETFYIDENVVSFAIVKTQTLAGAYDQTYYFNIDMQSGKNIPLKEIVNIDEEEIKNVVMKQMENIMKTNDKIVYDVEALQGLSIDDDRKYYINNNGEIVIVFDKYEVAPGYLGEQHFSIVKLK